MIHFGAPKTIIFRIEKDIIFENPKPGIVMKSQIWRPKIKIQPKIKIIKIDRKIKFRAGKEIENFWPSRKRNLNFGSILA